MNIGTCCLIEADAKIILTNYIRKKGRKGKGVRKGVIRKGVRHRNDAYSPFSATFFEPASCFLTSFLTSALRE